MSGGQHQRDFFTLAGSPMQAKFRTWGLDSDDQVCQVHDVRLQLGRRVDRACQETLNLHRSMGTRGLQVPCLARRNISTSIENIFCGLGSG